MLTIESKHCPDKAWSAILELEIGVALGARLVGCSLQVW
jgi:hypothetical protein